VRRAFHVTSTRLDHAVHENLRPHFHRAVTNVCKNAHWTIAITLQPTQKLSLRPQTKQCCAIIYEIDNCLCVLIIGANLKGNDSLTACRQKNFG